MRPGLAGRALNVGDAREAGQRLVFLLLFGCPGRYAAGCEAAGNPEVAECRRLVPFPSGPPHPRARLRLGGLRKSSTRGGRRSARAGRRRPCGRFVLPRWRGCSGVGGTGGAVASSAAATKSACLGIDWLGTGTVQAPQQGIEPLLHRFPVPAFAAQGTDEFRDHLLEDSGIIGQGRGVDRRCWRRGQCRCVRAHAYKLKCTSGCFCSVNWRHSF